MTLTVVKYADLEITKHADPHHRERRRRDHLDDRRHQPRAVAGGDAVVTDHLPGRSTFLSSEPGRTDVPEVGSDAHLHLRVDPVRRDEDDHGPHRDQRPAAVEHDDPGATSTS